MRAPQPHPNSTWARRYGNDLFDPGPDEPLQFPWTIDAAARRAARSNSDLSEHMRVRRKRPRPPETVRPPQPISSTQLPRRGRVRLLSEEEEWRLGQFARGVRDPRPNPIAPAEARRRLVESHRPLVISIAREYRGRGIELDELAQFGYDGLLKAVGRFDPNRGRLATYAAHWIKKYILAEFKRRARAAEGTESLPDDADDDVEHPASSGDPRDPADVVADEDERRRFDDQIVSRLDERQRRVLELHADGVHQDVIAVREGISSTRQVRRIIEETRAQLASFRPRRVGAHVTTSIGGEE